MVKKIEDTRPAGEQKKFSLNVGEDMPLMEFLQLKLKDYSRSAIKSLISHRQLYLNGEVSLQRYDHPLHKGDRVDVRSFRGNRGHVLDHPKLKMVYEDDDIIVVEKKEGLLSVRGDNLAEETATHILNNYLRPLGRRSHIFVVHRLDRGTSGVMMFVKSKEVQDKMREDWTSFIKERTYIAVAEGVFEQKEGVIDSYLTEDGKQKMHSSDTDNGGQHAITHYKVLSQGKKYALVKLNLETGRKNQIRVHLESIGHPIAGDVKYGGHDSVAKRLCLHAETLRFSHPVTGRLMAFEIPTPEIFKRMTSTQVLRNDLTNRQ